MITTKTIEIEHTDCGVPIFTSNEQGVLKVSVSSSNDESLPEFLIEGDQEGLEAFARLVMSVALTRGIHSHIDNQSHPKLLRTPNVMITIANLAKPKIEVSSSESAPPPDW